MYSKNKVKLLGWFGALIFLSACSANVSSDKSSFNIAAISGNIWQSTEYPFKDGDAAYCVIDGGRNNLRIIMELAKGSSEVINFVESTRPMTPGVIFSINSSERSLRTYEDALSAKKSQLIISDLLNGQNIYLRWSEPHGSSGGRQNFTNIITPDNFIPPYQKCQKFINELAGQ